MCDDNIDDDVEFSASLRQYGNFWELRSFEERRQHCDDEKAVDDALDDRQLPHDGPDN